MPSNDEEQAEVKQCDIVDTTEDDDVPNLTCFIMMLDVLLKQVGYLVSQKFCSHSLLSLLILLTGNFF